MRILSLDTATRLGSIALVDGRQRHCVAETRFDAVITHTERLLPAIDALLKKARWDLSHLNGLALTIGPGSFTGLRVGLSTLKGFAQVLKLPLVGVSSLEALAHNEWCRSIPVAAILDAKRGEVYAAVYRFDQENIKEIMFKEKAVKPEILCDTLSKMGPCCLLGEGLLAYEKLFKERLPGKSFFSGKGGIEAKWVAHLALPRLERGEGKNWACLTPNYLRLSDAELSKT